MNYEVLSVVFLFAVVALGFWRKCNIGILAVGFSLIIGKIGGMSNSQILGGFDAKLFITLVGVTFLFGIAQSNGTLELIAKRAVGLAGNRTYLVPVILFLVTGLLSAIGPGNIPVGALMTVVAVTIAVEMGENPLLFALAAKVAANGFTITPLAPAGVLTMSLSETAGYTDIIMPVMLNVMLWAVIMMVGFSIHYKIYRIKPGAVAVGGAVSEKKPVTRDQWITIVGMCVMVYLVMFRRLDVGLTSFFVVAVLILLGVAKEKQALAKIPWGTLLLICGVGVLMNVVIEMGGIDLISEALLAIMTPATAAPIIAFISSILSFFSSTTGVVIPTMVPTIGTIVDSLGTGSAGFISLTSVMISSSLSSAFSPASTGGGLILAAYMAASNSENKEQEQQKLFGRLFMIAIACVIANIILSAVGVYGIIK